jgi:microcystin-dependent protein
MADKFRTQDAPLMGRLCLRLEIPDSQWFWRELLDCLRDMILDDNWVQVGAVTVADAVQAATTMYWSVETMIGQVIPYVTAVRPDNTLDCDGTEYAITDYPALAAVLDSAYFTDSAHFRVPDFRGRIPIGTGTGDALTPRAVNATGGEETHQLSEAEMPAHYHTDTGHMHSIHSHIPGLALAPGELPVDCPNPFPEGTSSGNAAITSAGESNAHNNMPPFVAVKWAVIAW